MKSLSVAIPAYLSQDSLPDLVNELARFLPPITSEFEVTVVDNASPDKDLVGCARICGSKSSRGSEPPHKIEMDAT